MLRRMVAHAAGRLDEDTKEFVPADEWRKVVWEARAFVAVLIGVAVWSLATGSIVPLLFIGLPSWYGIWLMVFFGFTQHAVLQEDVLDHRMNTRTVYMNPLFRFLYSNMNYHVEHHIFPTVPYHALPSLHAEVKDHLAPATPSTLAAYREILGAVPSRPSIRRTRSPIAACRSTMARRVPARRRRVPLGRRHDDGRHRPGVGCGHRGRQGVPGRCR